MDAIRWITCNVGGKEIFSTLRERGQQIAGEGFGKFAPTQPVKSENGPI